MRFRKCQDHAPRCHCGKFAVSLKGGPLCAGHYQQRRRTGKVKKGPTRAWNEGHGEWPTLPEWRAPLEAVTRLQKRIEKDPNLFRDYLEKWTIDYASGRNEPGNPLEDAAYAAAVLAPRFRVSPRTHQVLTQAAAAAKVPASRFIGGLLWEFIVSSSRGPAAKALAPVSKDTPPPPKTAVPPKVRKAR